MRCAYCNSNKFIPRPLSEVWVEFAKAALSGILPAGMHTKDEAVRDATVLGDLMLAEYEKRFGGVDLPDESPRITVKVDGALTREEFLRRVWSEGRWFPPSWIVEVRFAEEED